MRDRDDSTSQEQHQELTMLLPWYVNGTLAEHERARLERHLAACAPCRDDLDLERELQRRLSDESSVEYLPVPSLKRLQRALDGLEPGQAARAVRRPRRLRRAWSSGYAVAASLLVGALIAWFVADRWHRGAPPGLEPAYRTVTQSSPAITDEAVRAVFAPSITLDELQSILRESGLRIVSGPTEAGVYSLAATSSRPVTDSLAALRAHPEVRFAEATRLDAAPRASPRSP